MKKQLFILMMMMLTALTTQAAEYGIRIAGVQVTDENKGDLSVIEGVTGTATYDSEANVLSLTDATIDFEIDNALVIDLDELTIEVTGNNTMTSVDGTGLLIRNPNGHVTLTGSGMLRAVGQDGVYLGQASGYYKPQYTKLTVQGPTLIAESNNTAGYGIRGSQNGSYAGYGELELVYGTIKAKGAKGSICLLAAITVGENATVVQPEYGKIGAGEVQTASSTTVKDAWVEIFAPKPDIATPLTIEAIENYTNVYFQNSGFQGNTRGYVGYAINDGEITWTKEFISLFLSAGNKVSFYGDNETYNKYGDNTVASYIYADKPTYIYGNVMSLINSSNFSRVTELTGDFTFMGLFSKGEKLQNHPEKRIVLPATKLSNSCYQDMFKNCKNLTAPPKLPATELAKDCYRGMFKYSGLTSAPELPATTLKPSCYRDMFNDCNSLTVPPELPATELAECCYTDMFAYSGLTSAPELPATTLQEACYERMFHYCTSITKSPVLPAETLVRNCYYMMFNTCKKLNEVTCYAKDISANSCTTAWLQDVAATGTFYKAIETWPSGTSGIPTGWTATYDDSKQLCGLAFSADHLDVTYGEEYEEPTLTNPHELSVTYSSSNPSVATVDAATGKLTILKPGTTTIMARFAGSDGYYPGSASYTLTAISKGDIPELAFDREIVLVTYGKTFTAPVLTISNGLTAKYSSSNASVATVNATTGKVTIRGKGLATITATTEGSMEYAAASAKYHIAVLENAEKVRCDANADGNVSITDAVTVVNFILGGGASAPAMEEPKELGPEVAPE